MSTEQRIQIPKAADKVLFNFFKELSKKFNINTISISALGFAKLGNLDANEEPAGALNLLLKKNSALIETCSISIQGFSVTFYRGGNYQPQDKSGIFDEILIREGNQRNLSEEDRIEITSNIITKFKAFDPKRVVSQSLTTEQAHLEAMHTSTLERLEQLNEDLVYQSSQFRQRLEEEQLNKIKALEERTQNKQEALEKEYNQKKAETEKLRTELEKRLKEIDDRDNRHARRSLREILQEEIANRQTNFSLTKDTIHLRVPIHMICCCLIIVFGAGSIWYTKGLYSLATSQDLNIIQLLVMSLKPLALTIGAIGMAIYYLRWTNRWFEQHSQAEFQLKQFQLDVDRASWVVETALEWKTTLKDVIPTVLLESITNNLFYSNAKQGEAPLHPGDQLASALLGTASKVRLKAGDAELEFDGKKLRKEMNKNKQ